MTRPPPRSTLFPYTTLFRSVRISTEDQTACSTIDRWGVRKRGWTAPSQENKRPSCTMAKRSEEHTSELQSLRHLVCRLLLEKKKHKKQTKTYSTKNTLDATR